MPTTYSSFADKKCPFMNVGQGSQVSDQIFKKPSKGILAAGIKGVSLATAVKGRQIVT